MRCRWFGREREQNRLYFDKVSVGEIQWALCFVAENEMSHQWCEFLDCLK